jgi:hypothetical protein
LAFLSNSLASGGLSGTDNSLVNVAIRPVYQSLYLLKESSAVFSIPLSHTGKD